MKNQFADYDTSKILKELGFNEDCIASYQQMQYPINDSGNDYNKSLCLTIDCEMPHDEQKVLWIEKENAHFHWNEGKYENGEHSRCELEGEDFKAPLWQQIEEWIWDKHKISIEIERVSIHAVLYKVRVYQYVDNAPGLIQYLHFESPITCKIEGIKTAVKHLIETAVAVTPNNTNTNSH